MFIPGYCNICHELQHAKTKLNDIERINHQLKRYVKQPVKYDIHTRPASYLRMMNDKQHVHFMCGRCAQFNYNQLYRLEKELHDTAYSICCNIKDGLISEQEYHNILRLVAGYYPIIYKTIELSMQKHRKDENHE